MIRHDQALRATVHDYRAKPSALASALSQVATTERVREACRACYVERLRVALAAIDSGNLDRAKHLIRATLRDLGGAL